MITANTREEWLTRCATLLRPTLERAGYAVPENIKFTCGFPSRSALSRRRRRIGECWDASASAGHTFEIFISPTLSGPLDVAATVAHELVHATVGLKAKHGAAFRKCAHALGLTGKMTATVPGIGFQRWFAEHAMRLGPYPHTQLLASSGGPKQSTRLLKVSCPACEAEGSPYIVRLSATTLERGAPVCPIHGTTMTRSQ